MLFIVFLNFLFLEYNEYHTTSAKNINTFHCFMKKVQLFETLWGMFYLTVQSY